MLPKLQLNVLIATLLIFAFVISLYAVPCRGESADDDVADAIQTVVEEEHLRGNLSNDEMESLLKMLYEEAPSLLRCYRMNKQKPRTKLIARMKLLLSVAAPPLQSHKQDKSAATDKSTPPPPRTVEEEYTHRIVALYGKHNPTKSKAVPDLLRRSSGKEHELYTRICKKYGVVPEDKYTGPPQSDGQGTVETLLQPVNGEYTTDQMQRLFEKMGTLSEKEQQRGMDQLVSQMKKIPKLHAMLHSINDKASMEQIAQFKTLKQSSPAQYKAMSQQMPASQRLLLELFMRLQDETKAADSEGPLSEGEGDEAIKTASSTDDKGATTLDYLLPPKGGGGAYNADDITAMFQKLSTMSEKEQKQGVQQLVTHFKKLPDIDTVMKSMDAEAMENFGKMNQLKQLSPQHYKQMLLQLPASQRLMMEVFSQVVDIVAKKKKDKTAHFEGKAKREL
jgi:hypothetical protein